MSAPTKPQVATPSSGRASPTARRPSPIGHAEPGHAKRGHAECALPSELTHRVFALQCLHKGAGLRRFGSRLVLLRKPHGGSARVG